MVRYVDALYVGARDVFKRNQYYPLALKTRWWSKKVSIYQRRGWYDDYLEGTLRDYPSWQEFTNNWELKEAA